VVCALLAAASLPAIGHAAAVTVADSESFAAPASDFTLVGRAGERLLPAESIVRPTAGQPVMPLRLSAAPESWMLLLDRWASSTPGAEVAVRPGTSLQTVFEFYGIRFDERFSRLRLSQARQLPPETTEISAVPVPAALWLFVSAAAMLGWRARRPVNPQ
jgi:hypothetical protein